MIPKPSTTVAIKLASIAVHADELLDELGSTPIPFAAQTDFQTIRSSYSDPEVQRYLRALADLALLPVKRRT